MLARLALWAIAGATDIATRLEGGTPKPHRLTSSCFIDCADGPIPVNADVVCFQFVAERMAADAYKIVQHTHGIQHANGDAGGRWDRNISYKSNAGEEIFTYAQTRQILCDQDFVCEFGGDPRQTVMVDDNHWARYDHEGKRVTHRNPLLDELAARVKFTQERFAGWVQLPLPLMRLPRLAK